MATVKTWGTDGTFKHFTIHAIVASKLVPVVCCYVRFNKQSGCPWRQSLSTNNNFAADTDRANEIFPAENEDEDTEATV
ncbi:hypothetical protein T06_15562 [Trichinella sp. T6]|nr:hypothetical protein T06_15562 [Trichinella sp. T6]